MINHQTEKQKITICMDSVAHESDDTEDFDEDIDIVESQKNPIKVRINNGSNSNTTEDIIEDEEPTEKSSASTTIPTHLGFTRELKLLLKDFCYSKEDIELSFTPGYVDNTYYFSLYKNDELIITALMETHDDFMYIGYVSTHKDYRRRGIGYRFLKLIFHTLYLTSNIKRVYLIARNMMNEDGKWYKVKESPIYRFWEKLDFQRIAWKHFPHIPNVLNEGDVLPNARAYRLELVEVYHTRELFQQNEYPVIERLFNDLHPPCCTDDFTENTFKIKCMMPNLKKSTLMTWPPFPELIIQKELEIRKKFEPRAPAPPPAQSANYTNPMMMYTAMQRQAMMMYNPAMNVQAARNPHVNVGNLDAINYRAMMQQQLYEQQLYMHQYQVQQYMYMQQMQQMAQFRLLEEHRRKALLQRQKEQAKKGGSGLLTPSDPMKTSLSAGNPFGVPRTGPVPHRILPHIPTILPKAPERASPVSLLPLITKTRTPPNLPPSCKPNEKSSEYNKTPASFRQKINNEENNLISNESNNDNIVLKKPQGNRIPPEAPPSPEMLPGMVGNRPQLPSIDLNHSNQIHSSTALSNPTPRGPRYFSFPKEEEQSVLPKKRTFDEMNGSS